MKSLAASWRLVETPPAPGDWNMAVDELLLEQAEADPDAPPALRLYRWDRPTLSLGYFQSWDDVPADVRARCPVVRRPTGGGAILHDNEVTYAVALHAAPADGPVLYDAVNRAIVRMAADFAAPVEIRQAQPGERSQRGPFFCFSRPGATDIIARPGSGGDHVDPLKLAGGAQRRRTSAILQHGTLVLDASTEGAVGLGLLAGRPVDFDEAAAALVRAFEAELGARFERHPLDERELARAEAIRRERYGRPEWLMRSRGKVTS